MGPLCEDQVFPGESGLRLQQVTAGALALPAGSATFTGDALDAAYVPGEWQVESGGSLYPAVLWSPGAPLTRTLASSLRLVRPEDGSTWAQSDEAHPAGSLCPSTGWAPGALSRQPLALKLPAGTPPGAYDLVLLPYDGASGRAWGTWRAAGKDVGQALTLGRVRVMRPERAVTLQPARVRFGPLMLLEAATPARQLSPGDEAPLEITWQAAQAPGESYVVVVQLLDGGGQVRAGLEQPPLGGWYDTTGWAAGEIVRDRHRLALPRDLPPGSYRLAIGVYRASDRVRLTTPAGLFGQRDVYEVAQIAVR
jgi:hypothetical protein